MQYKYISLHLDMFYKALTLYNFKYVGNIQLFYFWRFIKHIAV